MSIQKKFFMVLLLISYSYLSTNQEDWYPGIGQFAGAYLGCQAAQVSLLLLLVPVLPKMIESRTMARGLIGLYVATCFTGAAYGWNIGEQTGKDLCKYCKTQRK